MLKFGVCTTMTFNIATSGLHKKWKKQKNKMWLETLMRELDPIDYINHDQKLLTNLISWKHVLPLPVAY